MGYDLAATAFYGLQGGIINLEGIPIYPNGSHPYGLDVLGAHATHSRADIVITLIDAWVIDPAMFPGHKWVPYFPVDMEPLPPPVARMVSKAYKRIVFSRFGERMVNEAGMDCYYVPHGIDTNLFRPREQGEARKLTTLPTDRFLVGMVAANKGTPSRKAYPVQIEAFARFHKRHPDAFLYIHAAKGDHGENQGVNLPELVESFGLRVGTQGRDDPAGLDVMFCDQYTNVLGFPDEYMSNLYSAFDVLLSVSMGEGFGIPIVEAQASGCPVIVGDWTSMSELCFGGYKVSRKKADPYWTPLASYQFQPRIGAVEDGLEWAWGNAASQAIKARARAGASAYDVDKVVEKYWKPVLADIAERVNAWKVAA